MRINFLTTSISKATGGAIYDKNFYDILKRIHPEVKLYDDKYFGDQYGKGKDLISFNWYYKKAIRELMDCDYLIINSRLYTRMLLIDMNRIKRQYPGTKFLVIHHHSNFMNNTGIRRPIHRFFEKRVLTAATELIIPNEYVVQQVKRDFAVNCIEFLPSSFKKKAYKVSSLKNNMLLFVGNVEYRKGIIYGIQAFKVIHERYPELVFRITGKYNATDSYYLQLQKYVEQNHLTDSVLFEGRVSDERLDWLYEHADIFLFPSLLEGYGWVMAEAMGRGVPVVAFDNSAMPFTVKDNKNGLLIKNKNVKEMSERVCKLLAEKNKMYLLQQGALETYRSLPSQEELNRLTEEYIHSWR